MPVFAEEAGLSENLQIPPLTETVEAIASLIQTQAVLVANDADRILALRGTFARAQWH